METSDKQQLKANLSSPPVSCTALVEQQNNILFTRHAQISMISIALRLTEGDYWTHANFVW